MQTKLMANWQCEHKQYKQLISLIIFKCCADLQNDEAQTFSHNSKLLFVGISPIRCLSNSHNITTD